MSLLHDKSSLQDVGTHAHTRVWSGQTGATKEVMQSYNANKAFFGYFTDVYVVMLAMHLTGMKSMKDTPDGK